MKIRNKIKSKKVRYNIKVKEERNKSYEIMLRGLICIIVCAYFAYGGWTRYDIQKNGQLVTMHVVALPAGKYRKVFLSYQSLTFERSRNDSLKYHYSLGDDIQVYYDAERQQIVMPADRPKRVIICCAIFAVVGLVIIGAGYRELKKYPYTK